MRGRSWSSRARRHRIFRGGSRSTRVETEAHTPLLPERLALVGGPLSCHSPITAIAHMHHQSQLFPSCVSFLYLSFSLLPAQLAGSWTWRSSRVPLSNVPLTYVRSTRYKYAVPESCVPLPKSVRTEAAGVAIEASSKVGRKGDALEKRVYGGRRERKDFDLLHWVGGKVMLGCFVLFDSSWDGTEAAQAGASYYPSC